MDETGLSYPDLVYLSRWGGYSPKVAEIISRPLTARCRLGSRDRKLDPAKAATTRSPPPALL